MKLENEVVELKKAVEKSPTSDQLLKESKDQLEIEVSFNDNYSKVNQSDRIKKLFFCCNHSVPIKGRPFPT